MADTPTGFQQTDNFDPHVYTDCLIKPNPSHTMQF